MAIHDGSIAKRYRGGAGVAGCASSGTAAARALLKTRS